MKRHDVTWRRYYGLHYAACQPCGWRGPKRESFAECVVDGEAHYHAPLPEPPRIRVPRGFPTIRRKERT